MNNKLILSSRISEDKFREILRLFCIDVEAGKVSEIIHVSRPTINKIFDKIRILIAQNCEQNNLLGKSEIELDESYFKAKQNGAIRKLSAKEKIPIFGIKKYEGKVYTQIIKNCSITEIIPIIRQQADKELISSSNVFKTYDSLADYSCKKHYRIKHSENEIALHKNHSGEIEKFWRLFKVRLNRFRGIHKHKFYYHLKECEFRYNNRNKNLYVCMLKLIKKNPIKLS